MIDQKTIQAFNVMAMAAQKASLSYPEHLEIQEAMKHLLAELNKVAEQVTKLAEVT